MTPTPPDHRLSISPRAIRYFVAVMVVVTGVLCGAAIPGTLGGTICTAIVGIGLVAVVSLIFYDVGLTEDRDRARQLRLREQLGRDPAQPRQDDAHEELGARPSALRSPAHRAEGSLRPRRPERMRGQRRRLR